MKLLFSKDYREITDNLAKLQDILIRQPNVINNYQKAIEIIIDIAITIGGPELARTLHNKAELTILDEQEIRRKNDKSRNKTTNS